MTAPSDDATTTMQPHPHTGAPQLLGELLIARCGVRPDDVDRALAKQREEGGLLGEILLRLKHVDEDQLALCLAEQAEMPALRDLPRAEDIPADLQGSADYRRRVGAAMAAQAWQAAVKEALDA